MAQEHSKNPAFDAALEKFDSRGGNLASMFQAALNETPWGGEKLEKFTPIIPELNRRLEEAKAEARERPLTTEQVVKLLQEPTTPESGVSITAIEELRAQLLAQLGELDPRNPAYTALLAKISSGSAKELSSLDGEIALAIAESTTEKAFASQEAEAEALSRAQEELAHAWHALEEKQKALYEAMQKAYERGEITPDQWRQFQEDQEACDLAKADYLANPNDPAKAALVQSTGATVLTNSRNILESLPEGSQPEIRAAINGFGQSLTRIETAEANLAATQQRQQEAHQRQQEAHQRQQEEQQRQQEEQQRQQEEQQRQQEAQQRQQEEEQRQQEEQQRQQEAHQREAAENDRQEAIQRALAELAAMDAADAAARAQQASAAPNTTPVAPTTAQTNAAPTTAVAAAAAPATTIVADATSVDRGATLSNLASPPRPVTVPAPTVTAGIRTA